MDMELDYNNLNPIEHIILVISTYTFISPRL